MPAKSPSSLSMAVVQAAALGKRIREHRKKLGVSTVAAADAAGISRVTLHRIEHGEPSVTIGAYLNALAALGLGLECLPVQGSGTVGDFCGEAFVGEANADPAPFRVRVADFPQLRRIAWHLDGSFMLTEQEALDLYERNWRHVEVDRMPARERKLLDRLVKVQGKGHLLV